MASDTRIELESDETILRLEPSYVARTWMSPGRRLGLDPAAYDAGERGWVCERWLASTTEAIGDAAAEGEGVSVAVTRAGRVRLDRLVESAAPRLLGADYARGHDGLGRLAKIFDYGERVPFHIHPPAAQAAEVGLNSKDEAYYFLPGVDLGAHPESFFGLHSALTRDEAAEAIVRHLCEWDGDGILELSPGFRLFPEGGYFVPSGVLHGPGTALTLELQEDSDAMAFLQGCAGEVLLSKELLFSSVHPRRREELGERAILDWIDWERNLMPDFHSAHRTPPRVFRSEPGVELAWLFWGGPKFVGKRLRLDPGAAATLAENGAFSLFVWRGRGEIGGIPVAAGVPGSDELLVTYEAAVRGVEARNTGEERMEAIAFFGPDLIEDAPLLPALPSPR